MIHAITHGSRCAQCIGFHCHVFKSLLHSDEVFQQMLKEGQEGAKRELRPELKALQCKIDDLQEDNANGCLGCKEPLQKLDRAYDSLDKVEADLKAAQEKILSLTEKLASNSEELAALRAAAKGKGPERDPLERDPKRARTIVSYTDIAPPTGDGDVPMYIEEGYPPLPPAGVDQQDPSASLRHKHTFAEMTAVSPAKGYPFNVLRLD